MRRINANKNKKGEKNMYFLKKNPNGSVGLNKAGRALLDKVYKAPKQHGKRKMFNNKSVQVITR